MISRRTFLTGTSALAAGAWINPSMLTKRVEKLYKIAGCKEPNDLQFVADGLWVLAGPAIDAGTRTTASITDVAPTVLHLGGVPVPSWMDGRLLAGVAGTPVVERVPIADPTAVGEASSGNGTTSGDGATSLDRVSATSPAVPIASAGLSQ